MRHQLNLQDKSAVLITFLGTYRVTLIDSETVAVEVLVADDKWVESRFTPWKYVLEALKEIIRHQYYYGTCS